MTYNINVTIFDPNNVTEEITFNLMAYFIYDADTYGNGYMLHITDKKGFSKYYDIRYDTDFHSNAPTGYLLNWATTFWSGTNGAYAIKNINITNA